MATETLVWLAPSIAGAHLFIQDAKSGNTVKIAVAPSMVSDIERVFEDVYRQP